jgi:hypothetical protein
MRTLIIKGALYRVNEYTLVKPHYTGDFHTVDATEYVTKEELESRYDESFIRENEDNFLEEDGVKYYYAEFSPFHVNENWELLSDVSHINFY